MPQPQPGNLDHDRSQPGIAGLGDALVPMDRSALPRRGGQSGVGGNLLSVVERAEQAFRPERGGWIQVVVATRPMWVVRRNWSRASAGVLQPRVFRGLLLRAI